MSPASDATAAIPQRRIVRVVGVVQAVGFRPFVHRAARALGLAGSVRNLGGTVEIDVEGPEPALDALLARLRTSPPQGARVDAIHTSSAAPRGATGFEVAPSAALGGPTAGFVAPDVATCHACSSEHDDPSDRRAGYPFITCTACGPRLSGILAVPYARAQTTLAAFTPCSDCARERDDPCDRRFHAENVACAVCGPRPWLRAGLEVDRADPIARAIRALTAGAIGAVRGVGGYHLVCRADDPVALARLRRDKARLDKPLAVLVEDVAAARRVVTVSATEQIWLESPARPIVILERRPGAEPLVASEVAPGIDLLGLMLPYTPLHARLVRGVRAPLVLTSANVSEEPMIVEPEHAEAELDATVDFFLHHDRPIAVRVDDSVVRVVDDRAIVIRAGRGLAPTTIELPLAASEPWLALGGDLKCAPAFAFERTAVVAPHVGDLGRVAAERQLAEVVRHFERVLGVEPRCVAHDAHPDFASSRLAVSVAAARAGCTNGVQHHHAHFAGVLAEAGWIGPALGVVFDGLGLGDDGALWGGEVLLGEMRSSERFAHLRYVRMPGGDRSAREPWRMALAHLTDAEVPVDLARWAAAADVATLSRAIVRGVGSPWTSSAGRLFDAVACIAGLAGRATFEGQAAVMLERAAAAHGEAEPYPLEIGDASPHVVDTRPLIRAASRDAHGGAPPGLVAARFHAALADVVVRIAGRAREHRGVGAVALAGGVFVNAVLASASVRGLERAGFTVLRPRALPPNDGGLALGQLAASIASASS